MNLTLLLLMQFAHASLERCGLLNVRPVKVQRDKNERHLAQATTFTGRVQNLIGQIVHFSQCRDHLGELTNTLW